MINEKRKMKNEDRNENQKENKNKHKTQMKIETKIKRVKRRKNDRTIVMSRFKNKKVKSDSWKYFSRCYLNITK